MPKRKGQPRTNKGPWKKQRQAKRHEAAQARQTIYNALTPEEKLAKLDRYNWIATKERTKIAKLMS